MRIYSFGHSAADPAPDPVATLGGKGAGLARMSRLGLPVPPGFTLPASVSQCVESGLPETVVEAIAQGIAQLEASTGKTFGGTSRPLLLSVRSGAAVSMPGMMDTLLNVGCTAEVGQALSAHHGAFFGFDCERRFLEMHVDCVLGRSGALRTHFESVCKALGFAQPADLPEAVLGDVLGSLKTYAAELGSVPQTATEQLHQAVLAVFRSWNNRRARQFRKARGIDESLGTAVTIQAMVFGNRGPASGTGVAFTRHPNTGENRLFGEFLQGAQGEDVVSGRFTPTALCAQDAADPADSLEQLWPDVFAQLQHIASQLEATQRDAQDLEFTVEEGTVWMLQTRTAERAARAATRMAVEMAEAGLISRDEALVRVRAEHVHRLLHPSVDVHTQRKVIGQGLPASPGAVSGQIVFDPARALQWAAEGKRVILVRVETDTADLEAMRAAVGILTSRGGMTSHAALVARGIGRCAVTGCSDLVVEERLGRLKGRRIGKEGLEEGAWISLDGGTGEVLLGEVATRPAEPPAAFHTLMTWADARRKLSVRCNADQAAEAVDAFERGAEGIGLCRTEHMFLAPGRVELVRELVLADRPTARRAVVERMLPLQREDFKALLEVSKGKVAIRLLDIPLHAFVNDDDDERERLAQKLGTSVGVLRSRARLLRASNPLLGHRGCRLGLTFPEVYEIQARALFEAALETAYTGALQVVVPLVVCEQELSRLKIRLARIAQQVGAERVVPAPVYALGPMIESPRACLVADALAPHSDFFLFGTNDLTIATFNMHRDDSARFLPFYVEHGVLDGDPFSRLDEGAVVPLIALAVAKARGVKPDLECGLAGAQTAESATIVRCHQLGLDFVSVSPHRVPIARLAAAQAVVVPDTRDA